MKSLLLVLATTIGTASLAHADDFASGEAAVTAFLSSEAGAIYRGTVSSANNMTAASWKTFETWIRTQGYAPVGWKGCGSDTDSQPWDGTDNVVRQDGSQKTGYDVCMILSRDGVTEKAIKNTRWRSAPETSDPNKDVWNGWFYGRSFEIASGYRTRADDAVFRIYVKKDLPRWRLPGDVHMAGSSALCIACVAQGGIYTAGGAVGTCTRALPEPNPNAYTAQTAPLTWPVWFDFGGPESALVGDTESMKKQDWQRKYEAVVYATGIDVKKKVLMLPYRLPTATDLTSELPSIASSTALGRGYAACGIP